MLINREREFMLINRSVTGNEIYTFNHRHLL